MTSQASSKSRPGFVSPGVQVPKRGIVWLFGWMLASATPNLSAQAEAEAEPPHPAAPATAETPETETPAVAEPEAETPAVAEPEAETPVVSGPEAQTPAAADPEAAPTADATGEPAGAEADTAVEPTAIADGAPTDTGETEAVANEAVNAYLDAISYAESMGGAYAPELGDLYQGLGQSLIGAGAFEEALEAFQQGVMVTRVNYGPNSIEQAGYLYSIAEVETRIGDVEAASRVMQNIYQIHVRTYGEDNPAMLPALERMYAWYTDPETSFAALHTYSDYRTGSYLAGRMAYLTEVQNGLGDARTAMNYRALGQLHFRAIRYIAQAGDRLESELSMASDWSRTQQMQEASLTNHYRGGAEAFERAAQSWQENREATELERAEAMAQLGDWYLAFQKHQTAQRYYEQAYLALASNPETRDLADRYLGNPTPLRFLNNDEGFVRDVDAAAPPGSLELSMTVTRSGDLQDIEVLNVPAEEAPGILQKVRRELRTTRFRPGLINGRVETVQNYVWKVPVLHPEEQQ